MKHKDSDYLKKYWHYLKAHPLSLSMAFLCIPLIALCHVIQPMLMKYGIDNNFLKGDAQGLVMTACFLALCLLLELTFRSLQSYLFQVIAQKTIAQIRKDLLKHVLGLSSSYFDRTPLGVVTTRLTSDMESLSDSVSSGVVTLIGDVLIMLGILGAMFYMSPQLTLVTVCVLPVMILVVNVFRHKLRNCFYMIRTRLAVINTALQEQLSGVSIVQLFHRAKANYEVFSKDNALYRKATISSVTYDALLYSVVEAASSITIAGLIWYGFGQSDQSWFSFGLLVAFIEYIQRFFTPLKELSGKFAVLQQALAALEKIFGTFEEVDFVPSGNEQFDRLQGHIQFEHVSFSYPGHEDKPVLKDVSFEMKPGEVLALVGPTGSGKTTVSRLISRLYSGYTGSIRIDGKESFDFDLQALRSNIAVVLQDVFLMSRSVAENIAMGDSSISHEQVIEAAKLAQAHEFIEQLPEGYETMLSDRGKSLSSGQAQLISFARALASKAPIILLDEATSAVDSLSEQLIQKAIEQIFAQKTTLVIAHRLSTIQKADQILALRDGELVEAGTHEQLMAQDGFYAKLFRMQFMHL